MPMPWQHEKTLEELQEDNERLSEANKNTGIQLSILQKRALMERLKKENLSLNGSFGGSLRAAWAWFKSH